MVDWAAFEELGQFTTLSADRRQALSDELQRHLASGWQQAALNPEIDALVFFHEPTQLSFHLIPGGVFEMGFTDADRVALQRALEPDVSVQSLLSLWEKILGPARRVRVAPFFLTRESLSNKDAARFSAGRIKSDTCGRSEAIELSHSVGFRLPSEAEIEWVGRDGGRFSFTLDCVERVRQKREPCSRFGIEGLEFEQWAEDDWHFDFSDGPATSAPWLNGDERGVYRGGRLLAAIQSDVEFFFSLAALRYPGPSFKSEEQPPASNAQNPLAGIEEEYEPDAVARLALPLAVARS